MNAADGISPRPSTQWPLRAAAAFAIALVVWFFAGEASAQNRIGRTDVAPPPPAGGDVCLGVPSCVAQRSNVERVKAGEQLTLSVECGAAQPYAWHWEPQQHGHIESTLQWRSPTRLTVLAQNLAAIDGMVTIIVGCSTAPFDAASAAARRPLPAKARYPELLGWPDAGGSVCDAWSIPGESRPAVPECIPVTYPPVTFGFWASHVKDYYCPADHPFYWPPHYTWDNSCFSCVDWTAGSPPWNELKLQCTNWCGEQNIQVTAACSKRPYSDGCNQQVTITSDPGCPQANMKTHCAGAWPVCFLTWNESCTTGTYAGFEFSCTADNGFQFCTGCKGQ